MPWNTPSSAPAKPAMAAEITNTPSLVTIGFTPSVAHAAGLSPSAVSRRPNALLCSQHHEHADDTERKGDEEHRADVLVEVDAEEVERLAEVEAEDAATSWIGLPSNPRISGCGKNRIAAICANAIVAEREVQALQAERGQRHRDTERDREQRRDREAAEGAEGRAPTAGTRTRRRRRT